MQTQPYSINYVLIKEEKDPAILDRLADLWLSVGRHDRAERLSRAAAELREAGA